MTPSGSIWTRPLRLDDLPWRGPAARVDRLAGWLLGWPLATALAATAAALLACWAPHYLTWPWWNDQDHFATFAHAWRLGAPLPYRDLPSFQFPGEYYLYLAIGVVFGWDRTTPLYAVDVALLIGLGVALASWSRREFGRVAPGLAGYLTFVVYYLNLGNEQAAQRDWHAALPAVLALMAAESWRSRAGRVASALLMAAALSIRPQVALLLPAMLLALDEGARPPGESLARTARAALGWGLVAGLGLALAFAPLVAGGLIGDLLDCLRHTALGSSYNHVEKRAILTRVWAQIIDRPRVLIVPVAVAGLAMTAVRERRRLAATWIVAMAGSLFYKPLSPLEHLYLAHNHILVYSVAVAVLVGLLLEWRGPPASARLVLVLLLLDRVLRPWPEFALPREALRALPVLARGEMPPEAPRCGVLTAMPWEDYRATIGYLRRHAPPGTYVANALSNLVPIDGAIGALPPMPGESLSWFAHFGKNATPLDQEYAGRLERSPALYVVWRPEGGRGGPPVPDRLVDVILRDFTPEARFGPYEIRRRK